MKEKRTHHYFKPGDLSGVEAICDAMSRSGWQPVHPGRFCQVYRQEDGAWVHRLGYCDKPQGAADAIRYETAQRRGGWEPAAHRKGWILFRKRADQAEPGEQLPDEREGIRALFQRRIARMESLRRVMLVLASGLLIAGYMSSLLPILYFTVLPLLPALFVTYRIKFLEEGLRK